MSTQNAGPSALLYCHDTYGLGHLRRTLVLAHQLRSRWPSGAQLVVTGSPHAHSFDFPRGSDYLKLPAVVKAGRGRYAPYALPVSYSAIRDLRRDLLTATVARFQPDLVIVDNVPAGLGGEIVPALCHLKQTSPATLLVLGLRDVVDDSDHVRQEWREHGVYELLDDVYDLVLVYGDAAVFDVVGEYGFSERAAAKTRYVGYLGRQADASRVDEVRAELRTPDRPLVLATTGGGGDGFVVLHSLLQARTRWPRSADFDCVVVPGPFASASDRSTLAEMATNDARARLLPFTPDLTAYMAAADVVVSMAGYNSICELMSLRRRAVLVPRVEPRIEQLIRARAVAGRGAGTVIHPAELTPRRLLKEVNALLDQPPVPEPVLPLDGLTRASDELENALLVRDAVA